MFCCLRKNNIDEYFREMREAMMKCVLSAEVFSSMLKKIKADEALAGFKKNDSFFVNREKRS